MATEIKLRRGTKAQHDDGSGFTGALGEVTVDTTDDTLRVHDGSLKGGHVIAKLSDVEASDTLAELLAKGNSTGSNDIQVDGTDKVTFGAESGGQLEIYEDGSQNGVIKQTGTGTLKISGIYGTLNNDSDEELISWDTDNAGLSWRGASGAGLKLFTKETGIGVTGTVNASDGLTADYIDLTGGKSTTTTGAICADQIRFSAEGSDEAKIYASVDGLNTSLFIQSNDDEADKVRVVAGGTESLTVSKTGIDVTGYVKGDSLTIDNGADLTTAYINSATGASILTVKSTYEGGTEWQNVGVIEVGGHDKAYIDLKKPDDDDTDLRLLHDGDGSLTAFTGDLLLQTTSSNSGGKVALVNGGDTKLETTATGINVTGDVAATTVTVGDSTGTNLELYEDSNQNAIIRQRGTGSLQISGINGSLSNDDYETLLSWGSDAINLSWQGTTGAGTKLSTTSTGIDVTGTVTADGVKLGDNEKLQFGDVTTPDLEIYHNGSHSVIEDLGTGNLVIRGASIELKNASNKSKIFIHNGDDGSVKISHGDDEAATLETTSTGINVTGTVEADAFSGTGNTAITDFITDVSTSNNDTTVPTTAAVKSYVDNNDGDTTYTGGTGLTLDGTTFNVDAAQTQITSVGTLTSLTTGDTTINGNLEVKSTTADGNFLPEIRLKRDGGVTAGDDGDVLGALVFEGDNFDGTQKTYARIGVAIQDDGTGVIDGRVKGEIRFACSDGTASPTLEQPSCSIDSTGVHINSDTSDGTANSNYYHVDNVNLGSSDTGGIKFNSQTESNAANKTTTIKSSNITEDHSITLPNSSGTVVLSSIAGGSINGGGDTTAARTTWTEAQYTANPNSTYLHFNSANTTNLVVTPKLPLSGFGEFFKFVNASPQPSSKIEIDVDGYSQPNAAIYAFIKTDASVNQYKDTTQISTITVDAGGYVVLTKVSLTVYLVEGIGYSYA